MEPRNHPGHQDTAVQVGQQGQRHPPHERELRQAHQGHYSVPTVQYVRAPPSKGS